MKRLKQLQKDIRKIYLKKLFNEQTKPIQIQQTPCNAVVDEDISNYVSRFKKFISNSHLI